MTGSGYSFYTITTREQSLRRGEHPHRRYSPRATFCGMTWCDSRADSIVWMRKDMFICTVYFTAFKRLLKRVIFSAAFCRHRITWKKLSVPSEWAGQEQIAGSRRISSVLLRREAGSLWKC